MKHLKALALVLAGVGVLYLANPAPVHAQAPTLDSYSIVVGSNSEGVTARLNDRRLGDGSVRSSIHFWSRKVGVAVDQAKGRLTIHLERNARRGESVSALNCSGIAVRCYDSSNNVVFSDDLPGFIFKRDVEFKKRIEDLPDTIARIDVTVFGQYE